LRNSETILLNSAGLRAGVCRAVIDQDFASLENPANVAPQLGITTAGDPPLSNTDGHGGKARITETAEGRKKTYKKDLTPTGLLMEDSTKPRLHRRL